MDSPNHVIKVVYHLAHDPLKLSCAPPSLSVYHGVRAPGWRQDAVNGVIPGLVQSFNLPQIERSSQFLASSRPRPALLNNSEYTSFKLEDRIGSTEYCSSFNIDNVTSKSITLLGEKVILVDGEEDEEEGSREEDMYCQRVYRFSVEVWPAPGGSVFRHTKVNVDHQRR